MSLITLLVYLIVMCLVFGLLYWLITMLPLPQPFKNIAIVALVVIAILIILVWLLRGFPGGDIHIGALGMQNLLGLA